MMSEIWTTFLFRKISFLPWYYFILLWQHWNHFSKLNYENEKCLFSVKTGSWNAEISLKKSVQELFSYFIQKLEPKNFCFLTKLNGKSKNSNIFCKRNPSLHKKIIKLLVLNLWILLVIMQMEDFGSQNF